MAPIIIQKFKWNASTMDKIKYRFRDQDRNNIEEYLPICTPSNPLKYTPDTIKHTLFIECLYDWYVKGELKYLGFKGRVSDNYDEARNAIWLGHNDPNVNKARFEGVLNKFLKTLFPQDSLEDQKDTLNKTNVQETWVAKHISNKASKLRSVLLWFEPGATFFWKWLIKPLARISDVKCKSNSFQGKMVRKQIWTKSSHYSTRVPRPLQHSTNTMSSRNQKTKTRIKAKASTKMIRMSQII